MAGPVLATVDVLAARPLTAAAEAHHANTVMDLSVAGDRAATIDFDGNWAVWQGSDLQRLAGGTLPGRVGRRVALSPDGAQLAVLTGYAGIDFEWTAAIIDLATGNVVPIGGHDYRRLAWTDAGLFAMGYLGYHLYDGTGRPLHDGYHPPLPGSAWMTSAATRDGSRVYFLAHRRIGGISAADGRPLPAPDLTPYARPAGSGAWAFPDLVVSDDGAALALGFLDEVLVWRLSDGELLARIAPTGIEIVDARVRFVDTQLVACFSHVWRDVGQRKTAVVFDLGRGRVTDAVTTTSEPYGGKGGAGGMLLVAHGSTLCRAARGSTR
jgi:hypothetical protein